MLEVERNRHCDFVHGSSKNDTSPKRLYHKITEFERSDGVSISAVAEKDRNSFYWHQKQPKLHSSVWRDLPDCKRLHTRNSLILLNRMETSWKLVKGTEIMIGRHTRLNKAWWISTQSPDLNAMDYTLLDCLCFKKCTLRGHNRPQTHI